MDFPLCWQMIYRMMVRRRVVERIKRSDGSRRENGLTATRSVRAHDHWVLGSALTCASGPADCSARLMSDMCMQRRKIDTEMKDEMVQLD